MKFVDASKLVSDPRVLGHQTTPCVDRSERGTVRPETSIYMNNRQACCFPLQLVLAIHPRLSTAQSPGRRRRRRAQAQALGPVPSASDITPINNLLVDSWLFIADSWLLVAAIPITKILKINGNDKSRA